MLAAGGLIVGIVGLVLNIVGVAIPYWYYYSEAEKGVKASFYFGLWKLCVKAAGFGQEGSRCLKFDEFNMKIILPTEMEAVRGLELTAIILIATSIVIAGLRVVMKKGDNKYLKVAGGIACAAGILMIVGAVVFSTSDQMKKLIPIVAIPFKLHAGFALCIVSGVCSLAAAVMFIMENDGENQTMPQPYPYHGQNGGVPAVSLQPSAMVVTVQQPSAMAVTAQQPLGVQTF
ncbi:uncharacterized protein LOC123540957 [Mercenaria mercenaria]|uniref:uncharacterized protein LOC123540957 n=1 Tax=Mercenaria mercenaria TaxID=6596 RepID=UPI00234E53C2|nr:uncharacterized protein LOC123540957 [Mercenaria mercenaria]